MLAFTDSGNQESLHRMRVEIKKVKAYLEFARTFREKKKSVKQPEVLKKIFHLGGLIREAGIHLQLLQQYRIKHTSFSADETRKIEQWSVKFRLEVAPFDEELNRAFKKLLCKLHPAKKSKILKWISHQLNSIAEIIASPGTDKLHRARKKIKSFTYFIRMLPLRLTRKSKINIAYLDQLQDAIGKWHDLDVTISLLAGRRLVSHKFLGRLEEARERAHNAVFLIREGFGKKIFADHS